MLCCTIIMISCRFHVLPGAGGTAKGYFLHNRLWKHCEHLILRIMLGQEKGAQTRARSLGSMEALLLITEWHPRSLHFPPETHGWDADLLMRSVSDHELETGEDDTQSADQEASPSAQWLEEVIEPSRRADRMSWMLLGCVVSLAHELRLYDAGSASDRAAPAAQGDVQDRKLRLKKLLYVFHTQLALRLGHISLMPTSLLHTINKTARPITVPVSKDQQWHLFMDAQLDLTKLFISISDVFFSSPASTRTLLLNGRYANHIANFQSLLTRWNEDHLQPQCKWPSCIVLSYSHGQRSRRLARKSSTPFGPWLTRFHTRYYRREDVNHHSYRISLDQCSVELYWHASDR